MQLQTPERGPVGVMKGDSEVKLRDRKLGGDIAGTGR
jgi:hypothetical protein